MRHVAKPPKSEHVKADVSREPAVSEQIDKLTKRVAHLEYGLALITQIIADTHPEGEELTRLYKRILDGPDDPKRHVMPF